MKPAFALDFRNAAITLLHRATGGWHEVGRVAIDAPDLTEAVGYLRSTALGLAPRGLSTKLVIPDDQILYLAVVAPGPDAASRRSQIAAALEGRTPYAVDDLVFDWWGTGPEVQVAVVARETLAEAEGFAIEHRMNPISFVAVPASSKFRGEPWFGPSSLAATLLPNGEKIERDQDPVQILARSLAIEPVPPELPTAKAAPEALPVVKADAAPAPLAEIEPEPAQHIQSPAADNAEPTAPLASISPAEPPALIEPEPEVPPETALPVVTTQSVAAPVPPLDEAPMALDVPADEPPNVVHERSVTSPVIQDDVPPPLSQAALAAFSSRRNADTAPPRLGGIKRPSTLGSVPNKAEVAPAKQPMVERPFAAKSAPKPAADVPILVGNQTSASGKPRANDKDAKPMRGLGALVTATVIAENKDRKTVDPSSSAASLAPVKKPTAKAPALARGSKQRGKPRFLGLILTGILLLVLALIAAWSTYSLTFFNGSTPKTDTASLSQDASTSNLSNDIPAPEDEMAADMQDPDQLAADAAGQNAANPDAALAGQAGEDPPAPDQAALSQQPATDGTVDPSATGSALPQTDGQGEIILATMDAPPVAPDPLALPQPDARGDPLPDAQLAPPPFGTTYEFDADGMIRPTPEGVITPEGVRLVAGPPPILPPERPATLAAPAPSADATSATDAPAFPSDPALSKFRPKLRPEGLKAEADTTFAPESGTRVASLRPRARPAAILAAGEAARQASAEASLVAEPAVQTEPTPSSQLAVAISRHPEPRPRDLSRSVEAAVAAAVRTPEPKVEQPTESAQNNAPEADNEPEVASAAPKIPTKASVAKQATFSNAINLSKINLIGVYGTQSNRSALVRQSNGRYKKVKVGDNLDGGRVTAITATEIRYQKGSKLLTLALPKS